MSEIKLTEDQQIAVDAMVEFLDHPTEEVFTLSGVAGAGKTFSIKQALHGRSNIVGAVISHAAKTILGQSLEGVASCITVAQLLGLTMIYHDDGEVSFRPNRNKAMHQGLPIDSADILVIDECSMIDEEIHNLIMTMKKKSTKVIYMGDVYQLPPISSNSDSVTFNYTQATLNNAVRYAGPIADLGNRIKAEIDKINNEERAVTYVINEWMDELGHEERTSKVNEDGSGYIFLNDINKVIEIATKAFKEDPSPEAMKLLAYRNKNVEKLNDVIRAQTHKCDEYMVDGELKLPQFVPGELVICDGGYNVNYMAQDGRMMTHNLIYNNQTFKVVDTMDVAGPVRVPKHGEEHEEIAVPCLAMNLSPVLNVPDGCEIYVMDYKNVLGRRSYFDQVNRLKKRAKDSSDNRDWKRYYGFLANFAVFQYNYVQNCYRAQGGTYNDVIVFDNDIMSVTKNKPKAKLQALYVSCTRARRRVYIYNNKYRVNQEELPADIREELGI